MAFRIPLVLVILTRRVVVLNWVLAQAVEARRRRRRGRGRERGRERRKKRSRLPWVRGNEGDEISSALYLSRYTV